MKIYMPPAELMRLHEERAEEISQSEYIRSPHSKNLKEMWCAAHFELGYERNLKPCLVWVHDVEDSDTDSFIKIDSGEFPFQTVIADDPERKMTDEYREDAPRSFPYEPERHQIEGPTWISSAVDKKLLKLYSTPKDLNLLVYANLSIRI